MKLKLVLLLLISLTVAACDRGYLPDRDMVPTRIPTKYELGLVQKSAEDGDSKSQLMLAVYNNDHQNYEEAAKWMALASEAEKISPSALKKFQENMTTAQIEAGKKLADKWKDDMKAKNEAAKEKDKKK
jgi:hypothetical protein